MLPLGSPETLRGEQCRACLTAAAEPAAENYYRYDTSSYRF
jgi:hypothetical protein